MALVLVNHSTIWDSPLTHLQKCTLGGHRDVLASTKTRERHVKLSETLTQLRHVPAVVAFDAGTHPILCCLKRLPKAAIACAGAAAAAAGAVPVVRDALELFGIKIPQPLSSPAAFMGHVYIFTCVFRFVEDAFLHDPALRGTAVRRGYLAFYDWFAQRTGMVVPRDSRGVPNTTLTWTFLRDLGSDRMSSTVFRRGPTWWQVILPNFLHVDPVHAWFSASSAWRLATFPIPFQVVMLAMTLSAGVIVNRISWAKARWTVLQLQVTDQNPPAIYNLLKDLAYRRSEACRSLKINLRRGHLRRAWASTKQFVRMSCRYSWLNDLNPGIGASGGLSFIQGFLVSLVPTQSRTTLVDGVLRPTVLELSEGGLSQTLNVQIPLLVLLASQDALIARFPDLDGMLRPTFRQGFAVLNVLRIEQWALAVSPRVGHTVHLIGATLGFFCGLWLPRRSHKALIAAGFKRSIV